VADRQRTIVISSGLQLLRNKFVSRDLMHSGQNPGMANPSAGDLMLHHAFPKGAVVGIIALTTSPD
jgi:hypothetical protein